MSITTIFKYSFMILRLHKHIAAPTVIASLIMTILTVIFVINPNAATMGSHVQTVKDFEPIMGSLMSLGVLDFLFNVFTQAIVISMVNDVIDNQTCSIRRSVFSVLSRMNALFSSAFFLGVLLFTGVLLFFIPAVIAAFFLMFTIVILISDDRTNAITAMKLSYIIVRRNINYALMVFLSLIFTGLVVTLFNIILTSKIAELGQVIASITVGIYMAFSGTVLILSYRGIIKHEFSTKIK
ncbi:MAG: hypothetical protein HQK91_10115 [Nitrospirae bacterium]|nr:hypothetical protein [Nitrospirota bacterium]